MPDAELLRRVEMLEETVESLQSLPGEVRELSRRVGRVESQVLQLRTEMRGEISAIRRDMVTKTDLAGALQAVATKEDLKAFATNEDLKAYATREDLMAYATNKDLRDAIAGAVRELSEAIVETRDDLARTMREQIADYRRHTTVLFEDLIRRLKITREGDPVR